MDELVFEVSVNAFFFDGQAPTRIRLHLVRDEVLSAA
jgi:hypothetical protein